MGRSRHRRISSPNDRHLRTSSRTREEWHQLLIEAIGRVVKLLALGGHGDVDDESFVATLRATRSSDEYKTGARAVSSAHRGEPRPELDAGAYGSARDRFLVSLDDVASCASKLSKAAERFVESRSSGRDDGDSDAIDVVGTNGPSRPFSRLIDCAVVDNGGDWDAENSDAWHEMFGEDRLQVDLIERLESSAAALRDSASALKRSSDRIRASLTDIEADARSTARRAASMCRDEERGDDDFGDDGNDDADPSPGPGPGPGPGPDALYGAALLTHSLVDQLRAQIRADEDAVASSLDHLSSIYDHRIDESGREDVVRRMRCVALDLEDRPFLGVDLWRCAGRWARGWIEDLKEANRKVPKTSGGSGNGDDLLDNARGLSGSFGAAPSTTAAAPRRSQGRAHLAQAKSDDFTKGGGMTNRIEWRDRVVSARTVLDAVHAFIHEYDRVEGDGVGCSGGAVCLLVTGPTGSGKTYVCDVVQRDILLANTETSSPVEVVRPSLPVDFLSSRVGGAEDRIISLFAYADYVAQVERRRCVILLDGLEHILGCDAGNSGMGGENFGGGGGGDSRSDEAHVVLRTRSAFLCALDQACRGGLGRGRRAQSDILVLCTAASPGVPAVTRGRFDRVFRLGHPDAKERREVIRLCLSKAYLGSGRPSKHAISSGSRCRGEETNKDDEAEISALLDELAACTVGRTRAEVAQCCREALFLSSPLTVYSFDAHPAEDRNSSSEDIDDGNDLIRTRKRLECMRTSLRMVAPESVRGGALYGFVDVHVYTSDELRSSLKTTRQPSVGATRYELPLLGDQASSAWFEVDSAIVTPLCRADVLDTLLYSGGGLGGVMSGGKSKAVCAGILLAGPPGSGKTVLARHAAAVASTILPSVRLLDVSCTSLVHKELGGSERSIRRLFEAARAAAPCVIVLDGIETVASPRGNDTTTEGTMDRILSTFLIEMDGIATAVAADDEEDGSDEGCGQGDRDWRLDRIAVIGITHDPSFVDDALCRPGRLDKIVRLDLPDPAARRAVALSELHTMPIDFDGAGFFGPKNHTELAEWISFQTDGMSAAEVKALCAEAAIARMREVVTRDEWVEDIATVATALKKASLMVNFSDFKAALELRKMGRLTQ